MTTVLDNVYIGEGTRLGPGAYIRANVIIGAQCIIGNSCEVKNAILTEKTHTSHFNYVGDSILGNHVHLGGGSVLANLRFDERKVMIKISTGTYLTDLRKVGAFIGNEARVGCNSVLQPGTVLARRSCVMSAMAYGGYLEANHMAILRDRGIAIVPRKFYT